MYYFLSPLIVALALIAARWLEFDRKTIVIILAGIGLYYFNFYQSNWDAFSVDAASHAEYIRYIVNKGELPIPMRGTKILGSGIDAAYHAPTYYLTSAAIYKLAQWMGEAEPLNTVRHLSVALYITFILIAACMIRRILPGQTRWYFVALSLLVFWPIGVVISGRIHCDLLLYVGQAGVLYGLLAWLQEKKTDDIANAFLFAGITCLAKTSGVVMLAMCFMFLAYALYVYHPRWREVITLRMALSVLLACVCLYLTSQRNAVLVWVTNVVPVPRDFSEWLYMLGFFDPVLFMGETIFDPHAYNSRTLFWHWFLRSIILGDFFNWGAPSIVFAMGACWLSMLVYMVYGTVVSRKQAGEDHKTVWFMFGVAAMLVSMLMYARISQPAFPGFADARYIYVIVVLVCAYYGKTLCWHQKAGRGVTVQIGSGLAYGFVFLTFLLYITQYFLWF